MKVFYAQWIKAFYPAKFLSSSFFIALVSGALMGLTTAPVNAWFLAWIALVPLWLQVINQDSKKNGQRKPALGFFPLVWGIGYHGIALSWITGIHPMTWLGVPWWPSLAIALFCWGFITLWGAALVIVWGWLFAQFNTVLIKGSRNPKILAIFRVLTGTALWCGLESLWSISPLWWSSLSYTQSPDNLAILHLGQLSGPTAVTASILLVNGLIAEVWLRSRRPVSRLYLVPFGVCVLLHFIGFTLYQQPLEEQASAALKIGVIQGNIPNEIKFDSSGWQRALEGYTEGYKTLTDAGVDAVLTPETALPFMWTNSRERSYLSLYQAILNRGVPAFVGGFGEQGKSYTNSLFAVNGRGEIAGRYDKAKLVPLGEYIPFEQFLGKLIERLSPLEAHLVAGKPDQLFETPLGRMIVGICYDSAFAEHFRRQAAAGGQVILTASNDAHYAKAMLSQHHAQDVMRAIETDRWTVRATNTGFSAFVNPHGETVWISKMNVYAVQSQLIYGRGSRTLYVRFGDWQMPVLLGMAVMIWGWVWFKDRGLGTRV